LASGAHLLYCARFSLTMDPLFAVVLAMSSYEAGRVVGNMAIPLALLAGAIKGVQGQKRKKGKRGQCAKIVKATRGALR
jgi:hypothetical protein